MKKLALMLTVSFALVAGAATAAEVRSEDKELMRTCMNNAKTECQKWAASGGGNEFPRGLSVDSKVELASGERYIMSGSISIFSNKVWLNVDFDAQPWLASQKRRANPFYRLDDDMARWRRYNGKNVTIVVTAQNMIWATSDDRYTVEMMLVPGSDPVVEGLQDRRFDQSNRCR